MFNQSPAVNIYSLKNKNNELKFSYAQITQGRWNATIFLQFFRFTNKLFLIRTL